VITPDEASTFMDRALQLCPSIRVAGIAGPGDTLATDNALITFAKLGEKYPDLLKCMSTNGLLLYEKADEVIKAGIDTLTVTVNSVDPATEAKLNDYIIWHGERIEGEEGARILIENQLKGIKKVADAGITVKVNTVLVPGINDDQISDIARTVSGLGAVMYNIIPIIPQAGLKDVPKPTLEQIVKARKDASEYIQVFMHCQHCRADAVGVPGISEYSAQVYQGRIGARETFSHG
jgi:nitrogen fixation protein NifB